MILKYNIRIEWQLPVYDFITTSTIIPMTK